MTDQIPESKLEKALETLILTNVTNTFMYEKLNRTTCLQIYGMIFNLVSETVQSASLSNESVNWIAQCYYDSIVISNTTPLDPNIFTQRAFLKNIDTQELKLMYLMFRGSEMGISIGTELRNR